MKKIREFFNGMKLNIKFTALIIVAFIIPIALLAGVLYYNMEQNVIAENISYLDYIMDRNEAQMKTNIDAINMSTQFTLSDDKLRDILNVAALGDRYDTQELMNFFETDVAALERLVNNNPLLYSVRVYASNDNIQEMMPVLYTRSRMEKLEWAQEARTYGWHFGYEDNLFSSLSSSKNSHLLCLVTEIRDYDNGTIGTIEVSMDMSTMFPSLYDEVDNEWSVFLSSDDTYHEASDDRTFNKNILVNLRKRMGQNDGKAKFNKSTYFERSGKNRYVISYLTSKELDGSLILIRDITDDVEEIHKSRTIFIILGILIVLLLSIIVNFIVNHMLRQFYVILRTIQTVQDGDLEARIERCSGDEMGVLGTRLNMMLDRIQILMQDNINREVLVKNTEIRALQNQINAHFIYNSLESIKMMAEIDEEYAISDAITALGKLLRYSMRWVSGNVRVFEELEYIKNYIALINLRFDYEIILSVNIPDEIMNQQIPKMSLQPIVENAILHGVEEVAEDTTIYLKAFAQDGECFIEITDSGKGMTQDQVLKLKKKIAGELEAGGGSGNGIGLKNVQDRIHIAFGQQYGLDIVSQIDCYTKIIVHLPYCVQDELAEDRK